MAIFINALNFQVNLDIMLPLIFPTAKLQTILSYIFRAQPILKTQDKSRSFY